MKTNYKHDIIHFAKGLIIGVAQILPAVSGSSLALAMGVYYKLLDAIHDFFQAVIYLAYYLVRKATWQDVKLSVKQIPFRFLIFTGLGMVFAIVALANFIDSVLLWQPHLIQAIFFGLAAGAGLIILKNVSWTVARALIVIVSTLVTFGLILYLPQVALVGIPAMILAAFLTAAGSLLPGLGGSFYLLILGQFEYLIKLVKGASRLNLLTNEWVDLIVFVIAMLVFVVLIVRLIKHLNTNYKSVLDSIMLGNVIAGFYALWPFVTVNQSNVVIKVAPWELPLFSVALVVILVVVSAYAAYKIGKDS